MSFTSSFRKLLRRKKRAEPAKPFRPSNTKAKNVPMPENIKRELTMHHNRKMRVLRRGHELKEVS